MRLLLSFFVATCIASVGSCTNDGVDLSGIDSGNNRPDGSNNTPDGSNDTPDGSNDTPDGSNNTPDGSNNTPDASEPEAAAADASNPDASVPDAEVSTPTFTQVQAMLMNNCGGCHITNESGGLKLTDRDTAYGELVGVAVEHSTTMSDVNCGGTRVVANDAANSVIVQRIKGTCANRMPKSGPPYLTTEQIQMVEDWINDGAKNN